MNNEIIGELHKKGLIDDKTFTFLSSRVQNGTTMAIAVAMGPKSAARADSRNGTSVTAIAGPGQHVSRKKL